MQRPGYFSWLLAVLVCLVICSCQKKFDCYGCAGNLNPVADAGPDQAAEVSVSILLNASGSADPDGQIISYQWKNIGGAPQVSIANDTARITTVYFQSSGIYMFELTVKDNLGLTGRDTLTITVGTAAGLNAPIANAGTDTIIVKLNSGVLLNGSRSSDPNHNIATFQWVQVSTHPVASVSNPDSDITAVNFSGKGNYIFELVVTDSTGLTDRDTVTVSVLDIDNDFCSGITRTILRATTNLIGNLSVPRRLMSAATAGNKIVFAGGYPDYDDNPLATVDIYDTENRTWSVSALSTKRVNTAAIVHNNKIYFAGGGDYELDMARGTTTSNVDIYDTQSGSWTIKNLSVPRMGLAATAFNNKLYFAGEARVFGGITAAETIPSDVIDIFDPATGEWNVSKLSQPRFDLKASVAGGKIYFAGGYAGGTTISDVIDVMDPASGSWSVRKMKEPKGNFNAAEYGDQMLWAGGFTKNPNGVEASARVEIFDSKTGISALHCLNSKASWLLGHNGTVYLKNRIIIFPDLIYNARTFEIFDVTNNSWHIGLLDREIYWPSVVVAKDQLFVADGASGKVWRIGF